jgi:hypothetical protein
VWQNTLLLDLAQGLQADIDTDGEASELEPQSIEDFGTVRETSLLSGLRRRSVPEAKLQTGAIAGKLT